MLFGRGVSAGDTSGGMWGGGGGGGGGLQVLVGLTVQGSALSICLIVLGLWSEASFVCSWLACLSAGIFVPTSR